LSLERATKHLTVSRAHTDSVPCIAHSPDERHIASASADFTIRVWDVETAMRVGDLSAEDPESALSVASSPGRQPIASTSRNRMVSVKGRTEGLDKIYVIDKLLVGADGWTYGEKGELLSWIPQIHRP
jgi:WD40 repeat protein